MMNLYNHNDFSHTEMGQQTLHGRFILESQASIKRSVHENLYTREKIIRIHAMGTCIANDVRHVTYSSACLFSTKNGSGWKGSMLLLFVIEMFHPCAERPYSISKSCFSKQNERYSQWPLWFKKIFQFSMKYFLNHGEMTNQRSHLLSIHCPGSRIDSYARYSLWEGGLDYRHGTGHGVGAFLNVHEGKCMYNLG